MIRIPQTVRISSVESFVWVNSLRKMVSRIFFFRSTLATLKAENNFLHFITEQTIHYFFIWHTRLSTLLILTVCSNGLSHRGVSVAQLQSIRARRSDDRLFMTQQFYFVPYLWPDRKKTLPMRSFKTNKEQEISRIISVTISENFRFRSSFLTFFKKPLGHVSEN